MMYSSRKQPGFSVIEVMIALALLAIFGSSLFLTQATVLSKLLSTHQLVAQSGDAALALEQMRLKVAQAALKKESIAGIKATLELHNPDRKVQAELQPINEKSSLHKTFAKDLFWVKITTTLQDTPYHTYALLHTPQLNEKKGKKDDAKATPPTHEPAQKGTP